VDNIRSSERASEASEIYGANPGRPRDEESERSCGARAIYPELWIYLCRRGAVRALILCEVVWRR